MPSIATSSFVHTVYSDTPAKIILSIPHDGLWAHNFAGHFTPRPNGVMFADRHVTPIANDILLFCEEQDLPVDLVRLLMPRTYLDANRPPPGTEAKYERFTDTAFFDERVRPVHEQYFAELGQAIERGIQEYGEENILVLDLHGFARNRRPMQTTDFDIVLGTYHRQTIPYGQPDKDLGGHLKDSSYCTFVPAEVDTLPNGDPFIGGYICEYLARTYTVNVIQIEIEKRFRVMGSQAEGVLLAQTFGQWLVRNY